MSLWGVRCISLFNKDQFHSLFEDLFLKQQSIFLETASWEMKSVSSDEIVTRTTTSVVHWSIHTRTLRYLPYCEKNSAQMFSYTTFQCPTKYISRGWGEWIKEKIRAFIMSRNRDVECTSNTYCSQT